MAGKKPTLPDLVKNVDLEAAAEDVEEYVEPERPEARTRDYYVEDDPILAIGDPKAVQSNPDPAPEEPEQEPSAQPNVVQIVGDPNDPIARLANMLASLMAGTARPQTSFDNPLMEKLVNVLERVAMGQQRSTEAATAALARGKDPSNLFAPEQSVFNPRGERDYPRPDLKCKMHLPWEAEKESLTREEIQLLNLLEPGEFRIKRNDNSWIGIKIEGRINPNSNQLEVLFMNSETGFNDDYAWLMPPLPNILRQILKQRMSTRAAAEQVMTMEDEIDLISQYGVDYENVIKMKESA
jgi:hypothetical protein